MLALLTSIRDSIFDKPVEVDAYHHFLMNLNPTDFWNIDFEHYDKLADQATGWDYRFIEGYDESEDYI